MKMNTLNEFIEEQLMDPGFKEKYDALEPEFTLMQTTIDAGSEKADDKKGIRPVRQA